MKYRTELDDFRFEHKVFGKGALALVVQLTRAFSKDVFPINPDSYVTEKRVRWQDSARQTCERFLLSTA